MDDVGKSVQALLRQLQMVPKGTGQVPPACIVRSIVHTWGKQSTFATTIRTRRDERATVT